MTNWSFPVSAQAVGRLALFPLLATAPLCATAQTELTEVVVTANRSAQLLTDALPHTTVIGRADIERSQAVDLPTLLSREAGFQFTQNGGLGTASNLFLRGSAGSQVLVLIDGVPLTKQDTTGTVSLEHIMLDQVERVEVVRGNVSAVYGSGAIGGVIQVFTRQGRGEPAGYAQLEVGTSRSARIAVGAGGQFGDSRISVGISRTVTDSISAMNVEQYPNENPDDDGYRNSSMHFGFAHDLAAGHTFGLRAQGTDGKFDSDGGGFGSPTDIYQGSTRLGTFSFYSHNQFTQDWRSELTLSNGRESSVYDASRTMFPYESEAVTRTRTLNWNNIVNIGSWVATAGFERQLQSIDGSDSFGTQVSQERGVTALFAGLAGSMGDHSLQFNLRYDDADGISPETTFYAGYGLRLTPAWKLIASASTAFNLPPLGYLYDPFSGNPALQPETARSAELGLQWAQDSHVLRMTLFSTRIDNLLQYDFNTFSFNNVSDSSNKGLEVSYSGRVAGADLRASLTLQDPVDETTGDTLNRRARVMGAVSAFVPVGQWTWGADLRATGERPDTPNTPTLSGYAVVNLTARYAVTPGLDLTARIDNLFDRQYQTAYGYNQPGVGAYIGVLWKQK